VAVHDWTRIYAGAFHDFHHGWTAEVRRTLQRIVPDGYYALLANLSEGVGPSVLELARPGGGLAVVTELPMAESGITDELAWYARKANAVTVRLSRTHQVVAVVQLVVAGNKTDRTTLESFTRRAQELLAAGIHLTVIDVFPPGPRDPEGIHPLIWGDDSTSAFRIDPAKPLTCAAYVGGAYPEAFVETFAIGDRLPDMPLFLTAREYVELPLEATYRAAYAEVPPAVREVLEASPGG
jgi:hypothetical protein